MNPPTSTPFIFDAHLDLAMNAIEWNRDLTRPVAEIRAAEAGMTDKPDRGRNTVCLPELRRGRIGLVVATQIARVKQGGAYSPVFGWHSAAQAWAMTQAQLAWYRAMEEAGEMTPIRSRAELDAHLARWNSPDESQSLPVGYVLSLEGADSIQTPAHLERAYEQGLRAIGPAHYGPGRYAMGTDSTGGFPPAGRELLAEIARLGMILDVTHLSDACFLEAIDSFTGPIWASHHNCRSLVPHQRQLSDEQIRLLVGRGAVIGAALDAWMIVPGWKRGETTPESVGLGLRHLVEHIDHICQIAGNASHVGLGSDLDGAFGREQTPKDLATIADLQKLPQLMRERGYTEQDASGLASGNFLRLLGSALP
ncbi:dipeptidase [Humisphaera borealis]|uniref:Membrane dipeptidase n=1 Tax=Humisphaera borealis TaxID=2807512 RepID=A0A7M2WW39_9BACT|nr:membrane dipeptidase [Humisphaera borealis]QOV89748.1 membrane dipeptidase [Humisphaera borealis]